MRTDKGMTDREFEIYTQGKPKLCRIREDLVKEGLSVPITKKDKKRFASGDAKREYRWIGFNFQIFYGDSWWNAQSIDFDFIN
jgi:hypothetical protein